jgi:hypothetical protein
VIFWTDGGMKARNVAIGAAVGFLTPGVVRTGMLLTSRHRDPYADSLSFTGKLSHYAVGFVGITLNPAILLMFGLPAAFTGGLIGYAI